MAEIGLVRFARMALEVSEAVLPAHRSKFGKRLFTQPQLLAILCLMRYEDWTFREAEVLQQHSELHSALRLKPIPDYTTLSRFLLRLNPDDVARVMNEIVRRMPGKWRSPATIAVDATGMAQGAVSSYFIRRVEHFGDKQRSWKHWLKWLAVVDVDRQIILAQHARRAPWNDCATLPPLVLQAHRQTPIGCVLADAEFDSERIICSAADCSTPTAPRRQRHPHHPLYRPPRHWGARSDAGELPARTIHQTLAD